MEMEGCPRTNERNSRMLLSLEVSLCPCGITEKSTKNKDTYAADADAVAALFFFLCFSDFRVIFYSVAVFGKHIAPLC